ncbi:uncharacterized protein LOC108674110 [Hyalella azteca]|uniref:Uncharacterized protein LOC108674110 n=1 Tax=Hyalella azteca TaxID=294128 RepID=A0A8B7NUT6_HYAAZ|nr:uncharacterized protein LOC108674110 [Hyalella azteca]
MGNSCCCEWGVGPSSRSPTRAQSSLSRHQPNDRHLLGGKGTGQRIYNKYQVPSRKPIPKSVKKTGRDNLGFQSDAQVGRYPRHGAKVHTHTQLGRLDYARSNKANINNKKSPVGSPLVPNSNGFNKVIKPGEVKVQVIGINTKDSTDVRHDHNKRKYSAATTVSLSALSPDYGSTAVLVKVEVRGGSWTLRKTGRDFVELIDHLKVKNENDGSAAGASLQLLLETQDESIQHLSNVLHFVLTQQHLLHDSVVLQFFDVDRLTVQSKNNVSVADETSADACSTTCSSEYSVSYTTSEGSTTDVSGVVHTNDVNQSRNTTNVTDISNDSSTNTLCAQVSGSRMNININLSYEPTLGELVLEREPAEGSYEPNHGKMVLEPLERTPSPRALRTDAEGGLTAKCKDSSTKKIESGHKNGELSRTPTRGSFVKLNSDSSVGVEDLVGVHKPLTRTDPWAPNATIPTITTTPSPTPPVPSTSIPTDKPQFLLSPQFLLFPPLPSSTLPLPTRSSGKPTYQ